MSQKPSNGKPVPNNEGSSTFSDKLQKIKFVKVFELQLSNMEGKPAYTLKHQLSVGSEVGNIIINDASISPRHCTFILQDDVVSVMDHGSVNGTFINGKQIDTGKFIILEETDLIRVGNNLEIRVLVKTESMIAELNQLKLDWAGTTPPVNPLPKPQSKTEIKKLPKDVPNKTFKKKNPVQTHTAANSLIRLDAVVADMLLALSIYTILYPFDQFRNLLGIIESAPAAIGNLLGINLKVLWGNFIKDYNSIGVVIDDLYNFLSSSINFEPIILTFVTFIIIRLVSTLLFGVSISEWLLGIRSTSYRAWARIGGALRVIIGAFTGPLLIFDLPAVASKRTLKEVLTFTRITLPSKLWAVISTIIYIPFLVIIALVSPLFQGFDAPEPVAISSKIEQRAQVASGQVGEEVTPAQTDESQFFKMKIPYNSSEISIIPVFRFFGNNKKLSYKNSVAFYHKELDRTVDMELFKTFDLKKLLSIGMKGNPFLFDKFPEIYNYVYAMNATSSSFQINITPESEAALALDVIKFTKLAFELSLENAPEVMQTSTPLLKSLMDYKASTLGLMEYRDFDQISFIKIGNATFMRVSYLKQTPFDLLIPLMKEKGRIFKITFDKKDNLETLSSRFYKYTLHNTDWFNLENKSGETLSSLQVVDLFSSEMDGKQISPEKAQALYGYYFEKAAEILRNDRPQELALLGESVDAIYKVMSSFNQNAPAETEGVQENILEKLVQNFRDLKDAVENKNKDFFGIEQKII